MIVAVMIVRDFKIRGLQWRRERQITVAIINENKSCTLECSVLTACLPSSSLIRCGKLTFGILWTDKFDNLCLPQG